MFPEGAAAAAPWLTPSADAAAPDDPGAAAAFAAALSAAVEPGTATEPDADDEALLAAFSLDALWTHLLAPVQDAPTGEDAPENGEPADTDAAIETSAGEGISFTAASIAQMNTAPLGSDAARAPSAETAAEATAVAPVDPAAPAVVPAPAPRSMNPAAGARAADGLAPVAEQPAAAEAFGAVDAPPADAPEALGTAIPVAKGMPSPKASVAPGPKVDVAAQPALTPAVSESADVVAAVAAAIETAPAVPTGARGANVSGSPGGPAGSAPQEPERQAAAAAVSFRIDNAGVQQEQQQDAGSQGPGAQAMPGAVAADAPVTGPAADLTQALTPSVAASAPVAATRTAAPEAAVPATPLTPEVEIENVNRLVESMRTQSKQGIHEATIRLRPEHFGEVTISIRVERGVVSAVMQADSPAAQQWLEGQEERMRSGLADQGLNLERYVVHRDRSQDQQPREQQQRRQAPARYRQKDEESAPRFEVTV